MGRRKKSHERLFRPARSSRARGQAWCILSLVLLLGWLGTPAERRPRLSLSGKHVPQGFSSTIASGAIDADLWLDPADLDWTWLDEFDPRWSEKLRATLLETPPFRPRDPGTSGILEELRRTIADVSFVKAVPVCSVAASESAAGTGSSPLLQLELELRAPVACVPVGRNFYGVDAEGILLSGSWPVPLQWEGVPLPVIGPIEECHGLFALARPGDWLLEREHTDALEVALSLADHLSPARRRELGHLVIDATEARDVSVTNSGIQLLLGGQRLILFGRSPSTEEPGELAVARKWDAVRRVLSDRWKDWEVLDVRWDQPELALRGPVLASAALVSAIGTPR